MVGPRRRLDLQQALVVVDGPKSQSQIRLPSIVIPQLANQLARSIRDRVSVLAPRPRRRPLEQFAWIARRWHQADLHRSLATTVGAEAGVNPGAPNALAAWAFGGDEAGAVAAGAAVRNDNPLMADELLDKAVSVAPRALPLANIRVRVGISHTRAPNRARFRLRTKPR